MYGRNGRVVFAFCLTLLVPNQLFARDDGRFEPPARPLHQPTMPTTEVPICSK
jgi:hypothetical protein